MNRVLEEYLRHLVSLSQDGWDGLLPLAEFAYNNSLHEAVGQSPFYLNYGRHPRLPTHVQPTGKVPAADDFAAAMADAIESAEAKLEQARQRAKNIADPARRERQFAAGDLVLLSLKNIALKMLDYGDDSVNILREQSVQVRIGLAHFYPTLLLQGA